MPTKPATLPRWATNLTNNDTPSSGQMDTGWTPGQDGVSDYDNYIKYWSYKWFEYLNTFVSHTNTWCLDCPYFTCDPSAATKWTYTSGTYPQHLSITTGFLATAGTHVMIIPLTCRVGYKLTNITFAENIITAAPDTGTNGLTYVIQKSLKNHDSYAGGSNIDTAISTTTVTLATSTPHTGSFNDRSLTFDTGANTGAESYHLITTLVTAASGGFAATTVSLSNYRVTEEIA